MRIVTKEVRTKFRLNSTYIKLSEVEYFVAMGRAVAVAMFVSSTQGVEPVYVKDYQSELGGRRLKEIEFYEYRRHVINSVSKHESKILD